MGHSRLVECFLKLKNGVVRIVFKQSLPQNMLLPIRAAPLAGNIMGNDFFFPVFKELCRHSLYGFT